MKTELKKLKVKFEGNIITIDIAKKRKIQVGDKLAGRHGNIIEILEIKEIPTSIRIL